MDDLASVGKMMHFPGFCMFSSAMLLLIILKSFPLRRVAMKILKEFSSIKLSAEAISHCAGVVAHVLQAEINNPRSNHSYHRHQWIHERAERGSLSSRYPDSAEISAGILSGPAASGTVEASPAALRVLVASHRSLGAFRAASHSP